MAKRGPQSELTDRNWDQEDELEEAGIFKQATNEVIQQRTIKRAKRRLPESDSEPKTSTFRGFAGLITSRPSLKTSEKTGSPVKPSGGLEINTAMPKFGSLSGASSSPDNDKMLKTDSKDSSYLHSLKCLNESVLAWIKQHVENNPYIILSPVFKDYEKYLKTIEDKKTPAAKNAATDCLVSNSKTADAEPKPASNSFSLKAVEKSTSKTDKQDEAQEPAKFSFGSTSSSTNGSGFKFVSTTSTTPSGGFSFGNTSTSFPSSGFSFAQNTNNGTTKAPSTSLSSGFSFGASNNLSGSTASHFGSLASNAAATSAKKDEEDEEYVPPKPEVKEIKEKDSVYSKRCKLFYKKDDQWVDRGVGNIHLKTVGETKTQIVVRADTNLGNILLNIMLAESLPMSRQGKNNVLIVCTPNPPLKEGDTDPKPVPMLIRVKTGEDADDLLAKLEERKKLLL